jgi:hypothetical protein
VKTSKEYAVGWGINKGKGETRIHWNDVDVQDEPILRRNMERSLKVNESEPIIFQPPNVKYAHYYPKGFKGGVGKSLCGCLHSSLVPAENKIYPASIMCRVCQRGLEMMEAHSSE